MLGKEPRTRGDARAHVIWQATIAPKAEPSMPGQKGPKLLRWRQRAFPPRKDKKNLGYRIPGSRDSVPSTQRCLPLTDQHSLPNTRHSPRCSRVRARAAIISQANFTEHTAPLTRVPKSADNPHARNAPGSAGPERRVQLRSSDGHMTT